MFPAPPTPNLNDEKYRKFLGRELEKVAAITLAFTAIARWVPGPIGFAARIFAVAAIGTAGETKKGSIGGAKTNPLPAPLGFADPKVYGLRPNFWLPEGSTAVVPQFVDLIGLGLNEQRYEDMRKEDKLRFDTMRKDKDFLAGKGTQKWRLEDAQVLLWPKPMSLNWYLGSYERDANWNIAIHNEMMYRAQPKLRHAVNHSGWLPMERITPELARSLILNDELLLSGSIQPEKIVPVNAKAIENAEQAEGIRRELVTERADP